MRSRSSLKHMLMGMASVVALTCASFAAGQAVNIPSGDLKHALNEYIRQTNVQLIYSADAVTGLHSHAVKGEMPAIQALKEMLRGTNLVVKQDPSGAIVITSRRLHDSSEAVPQETATDLASAATIETVTVTGSRVIANGNDAPTPLTVVSLGELKVNTPSNVPDALNKLPIFNGSRSPRTTGGSTINWSGNFLNLRNFGTTRTLILFNGNRVATTDASGNTDSNTLPQGLMKRIDVVTGGASAVYGSDAITGVVNFVIDPKFDGLQLSAQGGISSYGDDASWKAALIGGTDLFGARGHFEFSLEHYNSDGISSMLDRPLGKKVYTMAGNGRAENPYHLISNSRNPYYTPGGYVIGGALANKTFCSNGVLCSFAHGTASGTANDEIGGDGGFGGMSSLMGLSDSKSDNWLMASLKSTQLFGRFDYDLTDSIHTYVQLGMSQAVNYNTSFMNNYVLTYSSDNAYLPADAKAQLNSAGETTFSMSRAIVNQIGGISNAYTRGLNMTFGMNGTLFDNYNWDFHYTHSKNTLHETTPYNINWQKLYAASDAVTDPGSGKVVCRASLSADSAALYPGCVPLNAFGPTATTYAAFDYITDTTDWRALNRMDDVGANIAGPLVDLWAGPINAALSVEYRDISLEVQSDFNPVTKVDCTGLASGLCSSGKALYNNVNASMPEVSERISEAALEFDVPLLRNLPFAQAIDLNMAARFAHYSVSGDATTWKIGAVWNVTDEVLLRAAKSRDIRAPTLNDMYAPVSANISGFNDYLTGVSGNVTIQSQGNVNLAPEVARTVTWGAVYRPHWLQDFSVSVDWYQIIINNAISSVYGGSASAEKQCIASNGTSPFCDLVIRPYPITNTGADNFPSVVLVQAMNISRSSTHGIDFEINYNTDLSEISSALDGRLALRLMGAYQPSLLSQSIPGAVITNSAGATGLAAKRLVFTAGYNNGPLSVNLQERWHSGERQNSDPTLVYSTPHIPSISYTDLTAAYHFKLRNKDDDQAAEAFISVENLFDQKPHVYASPGANSAQGYAYPAPADEDVIGRYFTIGLRYKM